MGIEADRFVDAIPSDAFCIVCNDVLENPLEIIQCGHFVCYKCWQNWKEKNKCPYCGDIVKGDHIRTSKITWNLIQNFNVFCRNKHKGCDSILKYSFEDLHIEKCLYEEKNKEKNNIIIEKCSFCCLPFGDHIKSHDCVTELLTNSKQCTIQFINLEHENNRLAFRLTTREKEFLESMTQIEGEFYMENLKSNKEIRDLRTRLANLQGELGRRKGQNESEDIEASIERMNGSLGFNIIGGATLNEKTSNGICVSRIVEGGAADLPGKLELHDRILQVDGVDLRNATHDLAVRTFRNSGDPVKMVIQRQICKLRTNNATTQTAGVMFAVTSVEEKIKPCATGEQKRNLKNKKWLNPHEFIDTVSYSDEGVEIINQQNTNQKDENKNELYDSAYDTLLTQKSSRSVRPLSPNRTSDMDTSGSITQKTTSPVGSDAQGVVLRKKKTNSDSNSERRHSTFYVFPGDEETPVDKVWEDLNSGAEQDIEYEYEEACLKKTSGKFGLLLCYGGDETDVAVYVGDLEDNSVADISGKVMVGDQIVQINGAHVSNVDQAYRMLQENDEITLIVARAVCDVPSEYYEEAEETDLDMLDCINEENESHFTKISPVNSRNSLISSVSNGSSLKDSPSGNSGTNKLGNNSSSPSLTDAPVTRSRAMTLSPIDDLPAEFQVPEERRGRSTSVNNRDSLDENRNSSSDRKRNSSNDSNKRNSSNERPKQDKETVKNSLRNFVLNKFGKEKRINSNSSEDPNDCNKLPRCDSNSSSDKLPRCDSNSSNNSHLSTNPKETNDAKAQLKAQHHASKTKAYLDSPSLVRHRINTNQPKVLYPTTSGIQNTPVMFANQPVMFSNAPPLFSGQALNGAPTFSHMNPHVLNNMNQSNFNDVNINQSAFNKQQTVNNRNSMTASVTSLRSAMKNSKIKNPSRTTKHVQIDPHPGWNDTERRVWEEFKIIQSMEAKEKKIPTGIATVEAEWRVRRSKDGKHVYIKKTNSKRNQILRERANQINDERCGITTDDDAFTVYQGHYWSKDQRRKQLNRHHDRKKRLLQKVAEHANYENQTEKHIAETVQRNMTLPGAVFDNFITVEEILSQRNRSGIFEGPIHVTTI